MLTHSEHEIRWVEEVSFEITWNKKPSSILVHFTSCFTAETKLKGYRWCFITYSVLLMREIKIHLQTFSKKQSSFSAEPLC